MTSVWMLSALWAVGGAPVSPVVSAGLDTNKRGALERRILLLRFFFSPLWFLLGFPWKLESIHCFVFLWKQFLGSSAWGWCRKSLRHPHANSSSLFFRFSAFPFSPYGILLSPAFPLGHNHPQHPPYPLRLLPSDPACLCSCCWVASREFTPHIFTVKATFLFSKRSVGVQIFLKWSKH